MIKDQPEQLEQLKPDIVVLLDACRWDEWHRLTGLGEEMHVDSVCTPQWLSRTSQVFERWNAMYYTANPILKSMDEMHPDMHSIKPDRVWQKAWTRLTDARVPVVHPQALSAYVLADQQARADDCTVRPAMVHYAQPHAPYIGCPQFGTKEFLRLRNYTEQGDDGMDHLRKLWNTGKISKADLLKVYRANLDAAWQAVKMLIRELPGTKVITADHGELLGEHGKVTHRGGWDYPELHRVPWYVVRPGDEPTREAGPDEQLKALGYKE